MTVLFEPITSLYLICSKVPVLVVKNEDECLDSGVITLFRGIIVFCGTDNILWNIVHIQIKWEEYSIK